MRKLTISLVMSSALVLSACETTGTGFDLSSVFNQSLAGLDSDTAERLDAAQADLPPATLSLGEANQARLNSSRDNYTKTVAQGSAIGGVVGAAACGLLADTEAWATLGCGVAGAVIGGFVGNRIGKRSRELVEDRASVDQALEEARATRVATEDLLGATEANIAELEQQVSIMTQRYEQGTISEEQYRSEIIEARKIRLALNENITSVQGSLNDQRELFADMEKRAADAEDEAVRNAVPALAQEQTSTAALEGRAANVAESLKRLDGPLGAVSSA